MVLRCPRISQTALESYSLKYAPPPFGGMGEFVKGCLMVFGVFVDLGWSIGFVEIG